MGRARAGRASKRQSPVTGNAAGPRSGAALILYGLIRQWSCPEGQGQRGEAGDDGACVGVGEGFGFAGLVGVADAVGSGLAGCIHVGDLVSDQGAGGWFGVAGRDGLAQEVRARLELVGIRAGAGDDGTDRAVERVAGEVGADGTV
jgi:hypothetical protein